MLYNKNWNKAVPTTDPMSMDGLIAWLETKPPDEFYQYTDSSKCLLGQWVKHLDCTARNMAEPMNSFVYQVHGQVVNFKHTPFNYVASNQGSTFGGALRVARGYRDREKRRA